MVTKCNGTVYHTHYAGHGDLSSVSSNPCSYKAVKDGFCKIHHPDVEAKREQKQIDRKQSNKKGFELLEALRLIANGCNNPIKVSKDVLKKCNLKVKWN